MIWLLFSLILVFTFNSHAQFSRGDQFQFVNIEGSLTVVCTDRSQTIICRDTSMDPWPYDVILGPKNPRAETIEVQATSGNIIQTQRGDYRGAAGRSEEFNLGIASIFQKPLLRVGTNNIQYKIFDKFKKPAGEGAFDVFVTRAKSRICEPRPIMAESTQDCDYPYSLCQVYFRNQNYCR